MKKKFLALAVSAMLGMGIASSASALSVTYLGVLPSPKVQLVIDDQSGPNKFSFTLTTTQGYADFLALGFNFSGTPALTASDFTVTAAANTNGPITPLPPLTLFGDGSTKVGTCGNGCNFNGGGSASLFDYIVRIATQGSAGNDNVQSISFDLLATGTLVDNPFSQLAVRAQNTNLNGNSIKTDLSIAPVPLPAGAPLLLGGLGILALLRRRRKAV